MERKYYRIKTFQEFGNKRPSEWNNNGEMDYLYGKFISNLKEIPDTRTGVEGYITWKSLTKIKTNLNTQQDGRKISTTDFSPESFLCSVSATYSTGSSPVGVAVCYSREEILL